MLQFRPPLLILPPRVSAREDPEEPQPPEPPIEETLPPLFEELPGAPLEMDGEFKQADYPAFNLSPFPHVGRPGEYRNRQSGSGGASSNGVG